MVTNTSHEKWSSTRLFILSAIGSAVGLGNIWRFPYLAGENGGGAFVLIYLVCVTFIALPILIAEIMLGRMGKQSPINTMRELALKQGKSPLWGLEGWLAVFIAFIVMTFYSVVAGWSLDFGIKSAMGVFRGLGQDEVKPIFDGLLADPVRLGFWHTFFTAFTVFIVSRGLHKGIENAIKWLMPALFALLALMVLYSMIAADFPAGLSFLLKPDFSQLTAKSFMLASSQAFFSVTIGAGAMMIYGAYLADDVSIPRTTAIIAFSDAGVAILAGLAIFPIVFAYGLQADGGPGLVFITLPIAFGEIFGGSIIGTAFFILLAIAALTSLIATLEPVVAWAEENRGIKRSRTTIVIGIIAWILGFGSVLSFNHLAEFYPLDFLPFMENKTIFDASEYISITILLPISGLLIAVFSGWVLPSDLIRKEVSIASDLLYRTWLFLLRWLAPAIIVLILYFNLAA